MVERIPLYVSTNPNPTAGEQWIPIAATQMSLLETVTRTDPSVRASFETLTRHMFGGGIEVTKPGWTVTPAIQHTLNSAWLRVARDIMMHLFCYGFVLIRFRDERAPVVLNPLEYSIQLVVLDQRSERFYRITRQPATTSFRLTAPSTSEEPLKDVLVFEKYAPDYLGRLTSIVPAVMRTNAFANYILACAVKAESRRAVPALFLEAVPEAPDAKALDRDFGAPGNNDAMHQAAIDAAGVFDVQHNAEQEQRIRRANLLGMEGPSTDSSATAVDVDPINQQLRYPVDSDGLPYVNNPVTLPRNRRLVTNTPSESPPFLMDLLRLAENDVAKITGVPATLFGSTSASRSNIQADITTMNIFYATQQEHRVTLQTVMSRLLQIAYGDVLLQHMLEHWDDKLDTERNAKEHEFSVSFPGLLDPEILSMLQDRGAIHWDRWCTYTARYYGIPKEHLAKKQLDVTTDRPMEDTQREQQKLEQERMIMASELKVKENAAKPAVGASSAEKSSATRTANAKKVGNRTKRPGSAVNGLERKRDVKS